MKKLVSDYLFDASEKKVTFTDYNPIILERVLVITNVTDGIIIYNFADPAKGGSAATNVLTLEYDTATMDDTDKLQIFYDDYTLEPATVQSQDVLEALVDTLQELIQRLAPLASAIANVGGTAMRVQPVTSISTAVTGPITSANSIAEKALAGVSYPEKIALTNMAAQANINNCVGV